MSLRDLGVFHPLQKDHPLAGTPCWKCKYILGIGTRTALKPYETSEQIGSRTIEAKPICATCHLKGENIYTPVGMRIVDYVKCGDGSPYPVVTTDGRQWKDEEVERVPA